MDDRAMETWVSMKSAPRDGTVIRLRAPDAPTVEMFWNPEGTNALIQPGKGIWERVGGGLTWSEFHVGGGPEEWQPIAMPIAEQSVGEK